jgi:hypothetical protein
MHQTFTCGAPPTERFPRSKNYRAGLPGLQEHVWGATLSTEVQVFASYPAAFSHADLGEAKCSGGPSCTTESRAKMKMSVLAIYALNDQLYPDFTLPDGSQRLG